MAEGKARQSVDRSLAAIARDNDRFRAVTQVDPADAHARAEIVDGSATAGPLLGLTFVVKDLIDVAGMATTGGSRLFESTPAPDDARLVRDLQAAGAVVVGKANMHELAVGGARNPWFDQVVNPLSAAHGTGGTSSGSVAAVAAGFCDFALGTDSGGSNRSTAAATGLYGYKPTNGMLSLDGVRPVSPTLDTIGFVARDGTLLSRIFAALTDGAAPEAATLGGRVFARPTGFHGAVDDTVGAALDLAADAIRASGGEIVTIEFYDPAGLREAGGDILRYEFCRQYGELIAAHPDRVGEDVRVFLGVASQVGASRYQEALGLLGDHRDRWHKQLHSIDALLLPSAPGLAPRIEDEHTKVGDRWVPYGAAGAELRMWANTIGLPAVAIPVRRSHGLPASIQIAARPNADGVLLDLSAALGQAIGELSAA